MLDPDMRAQLSQPMPRQSLIDAYITDLLESTGIIIRAFSDFARAQNRDPAHATLTLPSNFWSSGKRGQSAWDGSEESAEAAMAWLQSQHLPNHEASVLPDWDRLLLGIMRELAFGD